MVYKAGESDIPDVAELALLLWEEHTADELEREFYEYLRSGETAFFLKIADGKAVGFAQCGLRRDYVEGTDSSPVGYLEGIFVREEYRRRGYAAELLRACENWSRENGYTEFASDCELGNDDSLGFHTAVGFEEANRIICFAKKL